MQSSPVADVAASDAEVVVRILGGDVAAYAILIERYQASALRIATLVTHDPTEAQDIAQDAFIKAFYALNRFKLDASFRAWLLSIVVNEARNSRSATLRRTSLQSRFDEQPGRAREAGSAEEGAVANEERTALLLAVEALREDDRAVLAYRYLFDMSEAEMAQALQCRPGTVKSRVSRSLARLREHFTHVAPLVIVPVDLGAWLAHVLPAAVQPATKPELVTVILEATAAAGAAGTAGSTATAGGSPASTQQVAATVAGGGAIMAAIASLGLLLSTQRTPEPVPVPQPVPAAQPSPTATAIVAVATPPVGFVMYGGDLTDAQRDELRQLFGSTASDLPTETVSRAELVSTLQSAGLPVDGSERAISSIVVACQPPGNGVRVHTVNITDIPAAAYANALVAAGVADASVTVAAPSSTPMTGETGLLGVLRAFPGCGAGGALPSQRLRLAYDQLHLTGELAALGGGWDRAAATMLRATQAATSANANDQTSIGVALDDAAATEGLTLPPAWRAAAIATLTQMGTLDRGPYGRGYDLQQLAPDDVWVHALEH